MSGVVFVVDGSSKNPDLEIEVFDRVLHQLPEAVPVLILVKKLHLPNNRTLGAVIESLRLQRLNDRLWDFHGSSAAPGQGIKDAFMELSGMIKCYRQHFE